MAGDEQGEKPSGEEGGDAGAQEPQLNRAERRALEHKKKAGQGTAGFANRPAMPGGNLSRGGGNMQSRLPRTGHK